MSFLLSLSQSAKWTVWGMGFGPLPPSLHHFPFRSSVARGGKGEGEGIAQRFRNFSLRAPSLAPIISGSKKSMKILVVCTDVCRGANIFSPSSHTVSQILSPRRHSSFHFLGNCKAETQPPPPIWGPLWAVPAKNLWVMAALEAFPPLPLPLFFCSYTFQTSQWR